GDAPGSGRTTPPSTVQSRRRLCGCDRASSWRNAGGWRACVLARSCVCHCRSSGDARDPLTLGEYFDGAAGEPNLDLGTGEAMRHAVIMLVDIDVIIDPAPAGAPFGEHIRLSRQGPERRPIKIFEKL